MTNAYILYGVLLCRYIDQKIESDFFFDQESSFLLYLFIKNKSLIFDNDYVYKELNLITNDIKGFRASIVIVEDLFGETDIKFEIKNDTISIFYYDYKVNIIYKELHEENIQQIDYKNVNLKIYDTTYLLYTMLSSCSEDDALALSKISSIITLYKTNIKSNILLALLLKNGLDVHEKCKMLTEKLKICNFNFLRPINITIDKQLANAISLCNKLDD